MSDTVKTSATVCSCLVLWCVAWLTDGIREEARRFDRITTAPITLTQNVSASGAEQNNRPKKNKGEAEVVEAKPNDGEGRAAPFTIDNAMLSDESGNYCAWSHDNHVAFLRGGKWHATQDGKKVHPLISRDTRGGVHRLFMWADEGDLYYSLASPGYLEIRSVSEGYQGRTRLPGYGGQWRAGTASSQKRQHLRWYHEGWDRTVLGHVQGRVDAAWHLETDARFHGLYQLREGYVFSTSGRGQDQTFHCKLDGSSFRNLESPRQPWVHTWSHPACFNDYVVYFAAAGPNEGDIRSYGMQTGGDQKLFHVSDISKVLAVDYYMNVQHFHPWQDRVVYSAHGRDGRIEMGAICCYHLSTKKHRVIVPPFEIKNPKWGGWPNPSQSPDGSRVAYQDGDHIQITPM